MSTTKKPIKLVCYTDNASVFRYARLAKTSAYKPDWYKELPLDAGLHNLNQITNMKMCSGFNSLFSKGFVLPMWSECKVRVGVEGDTDYNWQFSDHVSSAEEHPQHQRGSYLPDTKYSHMKLGAPWLVFCEEDIDFMVTPIPWVSDKPEELLVLTGILDFNRNHEINTNVMIRRRSEEQLLTIEFGVPLTQFIPLSDRPIELDVRLVDSIEFDKMKTSSTRVVGRGMQYMKSKSKHDHGCPFIHKD